MSIATACSINASITAEFTGVVIQRIVTNIPRPGRNKS